MRYYNKKGEPITLEEWGRLLKDHNYKRVALTELPNGKSVSTVWLGLDHAFRGPKLIFETMVFAEGSASDLDMDRYSTEAEALAGHEAMVKKHSTPKADGEWNET